MREMREKSQGSIVEGLKIFVERLEGRLGKLSEQYLFLR